MSYLAKHIGFVDKNWMVNEADVHALVITLNIFYGCWPLMT